MSDNTTVLGRAARAQGEDATIYGVKAILSLFTPGTSHIHAPHLRPQLEALARRDLVARYDESPDRWCITKRGELVRDAR